jgi:dUTPase
MTQIKIQRLDKTLELPKYRFEHDAGLDIMSAEEYLLKPMETFGSSGPK